MIFYFTGTGNSRYIAKQIAAVTGDELISLNDKIKRKDTKSIEATERLVFVVPTYAWRIPRVVEQWIRETEFAGTHKAWFIMDCGSEIGNAAKYIKKLCVQKRFTYMGTAQIIMPENYIALFNAPKEAQAKRIIKRADPAIQAAAQAIQTGEMLPAPRNNLYDRFMSSAVNPIFYRMYVKADAFRADDTCTGCGKCKKLCPLNNIEIRDGKPEWGKNCTHCMACICLCPVSAIEYGKKSVGKPRYHCD